ncbi:aldehyde reductase [Neofusicoccum parvum]|nr:aldehyde reductase [Neofusicoccum parvum]
MVEEGAFDAAVKGVTGVAHVAAVVSLDTDAENVAKETVRGTMSALKSAAKEPSVKRFVLTSSSSAVRQLADCEGGKTITADEYNDKAVELAKAMDDSLTEREKGLVAYSAAKTKGERAMWDWIKENKPEFVANSGKLLRGNYFQ